MKISIPSIAALTFSLFLGSANAADTMSVVDVHAKRTELAEKQVTVTGKVIKVNNGIMRRNFVHVQDDSTNAEFDRLIFTSQQTAQVGQQVTATGTVKLDTDFGMGYFYPTLVEESSFKVIQ